MTFLTYQNILHHIKNKNLWIGFVSNMIDRIDNHETAVCSKYYTVQPAMEIITIRLIFEPSLYFFTSVLR